MPDFALENAHAPKTVCGLDEVGRGPCAGPVVAACVYIPTENRANPLWQHVNDSKLIAPKKREALAAEIKYLCDWAIAECTPHEIETLNILQASFTAMEKAFLQLKEKPHHALIDGNRTPKSFPCATQAVIKGDSKSVSIAAASILAKVHRDNLMSELAAIHPHYGWERNSGYPTPEHLAAINRHGITTHHRKSFAPVRNFLEFGATETQRAMAV